MIAQFSDLEKKTVLVTGASRGIGLAIAKSLAKQKAHVVFNYREGKEEIALKIKQELLDLGASDVHHLLFDITNAGQVKECLTNFTKEVAPISGVVNNAGISKDQLFLRLKEEDLSQIIDTNLKGAIMLTQALSRNFLRAENVSIVNMSSIVGLMGNTAQVAYSASKAGLIGFTKSLAKELGSKNIRCNAICPGFIETDMTGELAKEVHEGYLASIPTKRFGSPDEVASLACFLLSQCSSYITGEVIKIDGGLYI